MILLVADTDGREIRIELDDEDIDITWRGRVHNCHGGQVVDCSFRTKYLNL